MPCCSGPPSPLREVRCPVQWPGRLLFATPAPSHRRRPHSAERQENEIAGDDFVRASNQVRSAASARLSSCRSCASLVRKKSTSPHLALLLLASGHHLRFPGARSLSARRAAFLVCPLRALSTVLSSTAAVSVFTPPRGTPCAGHRGASPVRGASSHHREVDPTVSPRLPRFRPALSCRTCGGDACRDISFPLPPFCSQEPGDHLLPAAFHEPQPQGAGQEVRVIGPGPLVGGWVTAGGGWSCSGQKEEVVVAAVRSDRLGEPY